MRETIKAKFSSFDELLQHNICMISAFTGV